eukprot:TRINITY_DN14082_c0_g1_i1.p1 TRINITY_DN14082_c0_g1~~TRINITY_DN14082_c0_g1_i1.p1  ORF type:complete len:450 (-),score=54.14 TRINITY_DN14082_c0_g1_i1:11-1198(-)
MEPRQEPRNSLVERSQWTQQDIMDRFSCPVCLETYNDPRSLRCGHSFCKDCLEDLNPEMQGPILCPSCRTECKVEEATRNFALEQLLDIYEYSISMVSVYQSHSSQPHGGQKEQAAAPASSSSGPSSSVAPVASSPEKHTRFVFIESQYAGAVIGAKRSRLQQVESATSTRISVPPRRRDVEFAPTDLIEFTITGSNERNVNIATQRVQAAGDACKRKNEKKLAVRAKQVEMEAARKKAELAAEEQRRVALLEQQRRTLAASQEQELIRLRAEQEMQRKRAEAQALADRQRSIELANLQQRRDEEQRRRREQEMADLLEAQRLQEVYDREHQSALLARSQLQQQQQPQPSPLPQPQPAPAKFSPNQYVYPSVLPQDQHQNGSAAPNSADGACSVM